MHPSKVNAALCCCGISILCFMVQAKEPDPDPWLLPTFKEDKVPLKVKPLQAAPQLPDSRELFDMALKCWPAPSHFRAELNLESRINSMRSTIIDDSGMLSGGGRASVALVARVPLYSAAEVDREREREYMRRGKVADAVGALVSSLADRVRLQRELDMTRALEQRAQQRVFIGVAETSEQVKYLEKVADVDGQLLRQKGLIEKARLDLLGLCSESEVDRVDEFIGGFIKQK